jgi:prolipoprotein diacylglyceryltransferase
MVWNFAAAGLLLLLERRFRIRPGGLFVLYVALYCAGRFWIELLRVDPAHELAGLRLNAWVALVGFVLASQFIVWWQRRWPRDEAGGPPRPERAMAVPRGRVRPGR